MAALLQRVPPPLLHRLAHGAGIALYRLQPARRRLVRENLRRVCRFVAEEGLVAPDAPAAAAAGDARALERLVRAAYGHYVRGYVEALCLPGYATSGADLRIQPDEPRLVDEVFPADPTERRATIVIALHFGAIELPGLWGTRRGLRVTAPMETVADPELQSFLARSRAASGLRIVPAVGAARELGSALGRGEVVALVADRVVAGSGVRVELFGAPTRLPIGPAALAVESGAQACLVAVRRSGWSEYRAHLERLAVPVAGTRRQRLAGFLEGQARAYERAIAIAPEQWWALFFRVWNEGPR